MTTTHTSRDCGITTVPGDAATSRTCPRPTRRLSHLFLVLIGLLLLLIGATACGSTDTHDTSAADSNTATPGAGAVLPPDAIEACRKVFARTGAPGTQIVVVWDTTASVADMEFPTSLAADIQAASLDDGTLSVIVVDGRGVAPRILAKNVALSTMGERDRPSVAQLAEKMPSCVQAIYTTGVVPTAPGTDLHRAMSIAAEIADPDGIVWTVSDMLPTAGQLVLTKDVLSQPADQAAEAAVANAPVDLRGGTWKISGLANAAIPLLGANREWVRGYVQGLCRGWGASGCDAVKLDPVDPVRAATGLPKDPTPPFPAVTRVSTASSCSFTLPDGLTFAGGSAELRGDIEEVLTEPLEILKANSQATLTVVGHTASSGAYTHDELLDLSEARAQAVAVRVVASGIDAGRVKARGVGDSDPLAEDIDPATGAQIPDLAAAERRVELKVQGVSCSR